MDRRRVLVAAVSPLAALLTGCLSVGSSGDAEAPPEPVVEDVRVPAVDHVHGDGVPPVESIDDADADLEFAATFENAGDAGDAAISLYLLEAEGADGEFLSAGAPARVTDAFFEAGERREVSFDDVSPAGYDAYYLQARVGGVEADVRNEGETGAVEVALTSPGGGTTDERRTLELAAGATETVAFEGPFFREEYDVRAEATDE